MRARGTEPEAGIHTDVCAFNCGFWCSEAQPNVLEPSSATLSYSCALGFLALRVLEDVRLLLIGTLRLHCQLGRHGCGLSDVVLLPLEVISNFVWEPKLSGFSLSSGAKPR